MSTKMQIAIETTDVTFILRQRSGQVTNEPPAYAKASAGKEAHIMQSRTVRRHGGLVPGTSLLNRFKILTCTERRRMYQRHQVFR